MNTLELRQKRANLVNQAREILQAAEKENRDLSAEETVKWDAIDADVVSLTERIGREEKQEERERKMIEADAENRKDLGNEAVDGVDKAADEYRKAFDTWVRSAGGVADLSPEERKVLQAGYNAEVRAQSVGTTTAGGFLVPEGFYNKLVESLKWYGGMIGDAPVTSIETASGNDIPVPTDDDTANKGAILAENTAVTEQDLTVGEKVLKAWMYTSKLVRVSYQLLQDSAFSVDDWLGDRLGKRLGRILNEHFTTGDDSSKPQGIVTASSVGKTGAGGQTATFIFEDLVDLEHSVDPAYRRSPAARFMFHDSTLKAAKKLKDGDLRPLWLPGLAVKEPDTLLGYQYIVNNDVAEMAASAKSIIFGDFSSYFVRRVKDVTLLRLNERYADFLQVAFIAFARYDGRLIDAGTDPVKHYANAAA